MKRIILFPHTITGSGEARAQYQVNLHFFLNRISPLGGEGEVEEET